jgi:hypothetical protein
MSAATITAKVSIAATRREMRAAAVITGSRFTLYIRYRFWLKHATSRSFLSSF